MIYKIKITLIFTILFFSLKCNRYKSTSSLNLPIYVDSLDNGMIYSYYEKNDSVFIGINRKKSSYIQYYSSISSMEHQDGCMSYQPAWWNKNILITSTSCGHWFSNTKSKIYLFIKDEIIVFEEENIIFFDGKNTYMTAQLDEFQQTQIIISDIIDSSKREIFILEKYINSNEKYSNILEELEPQFINEDNSRSVFSIKEDTVLFKLLGKDTFYIKSK